MSVVELFGVFVLIPGGIIALLALLTLAPGMARAPRYRPGQPWEHEPVWWSANPEGGPGPSPAGAEADSVGPRGGARGTW